MINQAEISLPGFAKFLKGIYGQVLLKFMKPATEISDFYLKR